jgi:MFS family permease
MGYCLVLALFLREKKTYTPTTGRAFAPREMGRALAILLGNISFWIILFYFSTPSLPGWATKNWLPTLFAENLSIGMEKAGPLATITIAMASLAGVLAGGWLSDRWVQKNLRGRVYTGTIGLALTLPALLLLGFGHSLGAIITGALCFGWGFGMFDVNSMPILCQFVSSQYRATGYGLMNLVGISAGALVTHFLGRSADAGHLGRDFAWMAIGIAAVVTINLIGLRPQTIDKKN